VKKFVTTEARNYPNLKVTYVHGTDPTAHFYDADNKEVFQEKLAPLNLVAIRNLMEQNGIRRNVEA